MSGAALDVPGASTTSGTAIQQWAPDGFRQQQWQFVVNANQTYSISNNASGMALGLSSQTMGNGAREPYRRFMRLATYPAPKPLSILTTVTLLEQLFSIPSSAAKP